MTSNNIHIRGFKPEPHQKAVIDELRGAKGTGKTVVVKAKRQVGKTLMIENIVLYYSVNYNGTTNFIVSPTLNQSRKIYKHLKQAIASTGLIISSNATTLEIGLVNGSIIYFKSAEQGDNLRGYTATGIICIDEAAYIPDSVYYTILPWADVHKAPVLICSTPRIRQGFFFLNYTRGLNNEANIVSIDWNNFDLTKFLSPERLEEYRRMLPLNQFKTEYLGEFADDEGMVFTHIRENIIDAARSNYSRIYVGIDFGAGNNKDYTSICFLNEYGEMVAIDYFNNLSTYKQYERLYTDIMKYNGKIQCINAEHNSIGTPMTEALKQLFIQRGNNNIAQKINEFQTSNTSKAGLVNSMQVALEQGGIKLLNDRNVINQFSSYEVEYNPKTGNVIYNGAAGTNDDNVISTMLAYNALITNNIRGHYSISII